VRNVRYVGTFKILHLELPGLTFEIPPAHVYNNEWVLTNPNDYVIEEVKQAIIEAYNTVWTEKVIAAYKKSRESDIVASYSERTLTDEQFAEILKAVPELLPSEQFFRPNKTFINKMKKLHGGKHVIDCGAGNGSTGKALSDAGFDVTCLDIMPYQSYEFPVEIKDATKFAFDSSMVCLVCRPDREDWFVETIKNALSNECPVIYVRKKNIVSLDAKLIAKHVGEDDEFMFSIKP
jgi:hypothetical protein